MCCSRARSLIQIMLKPFGHEISGEGDTLNKPNCWTSVLCKAWCTYRQIVCIQAIRSTISDNISWFRDKYTTYTQSNYLWLLKTKHPSSCSVLFLSSLLWIASTNREFAKIRIHKPYLSTFLTLWISFEIHSQIQRHQRCKLLTKSIKNELVGTKILWRW